MAIPRLADSELKSFLSKRLIAKLATEGSDGFPHVVPVWFLYAKGELLIPTNRETVKVRNIRMNNKVSVLVDAAQDAFKIKGVLVKGRAALSESKDALEANRQIHLKYLPQKTLADARVSESLSGDDVTIRVSPETIISWDETKSPISKLDGFDLEF